MIQTSINSIFLLVIFSLFGSSVYAQEEKKSQAAINAEIDEYYEELLKELKITGASIAIVEKGVLVHAKGYGFADLGNNIPATAETIYPIASATKSFTALAVLQLHEKGLLNINESIKTYIPYF